MLLHFSWRENVNQSQFHFWKENKFFNNGTGYYVSTKRKILTSFYFFSKKKDMILSWFFQEKIGDEFPSFSQEKIEKDFDSVPKKKGVVFHSFSKKKRLVLSLLSQEKLETSSFQEKKWERFDIFFSKKKGETDLWYLCNFVVPKLNLLIPHRTLGWCGFRGHNC